jgi:hypothetical protein
VPDDLMAGLRLDQIWAGEPQADGAARRLCDSSFNHLYGLNADTMPAWILSARSSLAVAAAKRTSSSSFWHAPHQAQYLRHQAGNTADPGASPSVE